MSIGSLILLRKELHKHPELSGYESDTAGRLRDYIASTAPSCEVIPDIGGKGVLFIFRGVREGPAILIRADMDALPIRETNEFSHKSVHPGISHKCGHDGHMAILAGLAGELHRDKPGRGTVLLLCQPAEETGEGAMRVICDPLFARFSPDYVFALHNLPGYPLNQVIVRDGVFNASVISLIIRLSGKESHAAEPEKGINPALAFAELIQTFDQLSLNEPSSEDFRLITTVHCSIGGIAYGTNPGTGELHATLRTWSQQKMEILKEDLLRLSAEIASRHTLRLESEWTQEFQGNHNHTESNAIVRRAAESSGLNVVDNQEPFKWGEDFGFFTQRHKGAMFGLGSGLDCPALHNPDYDFPDQLIPAGVSVFKSIIMELCQNDI